MGIARGLADSYLDYARAMRLRLPRVGELLRGRRYRLPHVSDDRLSHRFDHRHEVLAAVDAELAVKVARWPGITQGRLGGQVDRVVARADRDAVRRRRERRGDREVSIWGDADGLTEMFGRLITTDAHAVDARLDALAATVCADDPRTRNQRRADAMGAHGGRGRSADLPLRAARDCAGRGTRRTPSPVVIHVIADAGQRSTARGTTPAR